MAERVEPSTAVSVSGLFKRYGPRTAVAGIDLDVGVGEAFALLGPNGAGKTTTVNVCTTRSLPSGGEVRVAGWDVASQGVRVRRDIGVVTQHNTLDRSCSVEQNLYLHCRLFGMGHRSARARTAELLETFQLASRAKVDPIRLSGGMVQRLQIARAIAHRPRVLFLDEPTTGLDPQSRLSLWEQIDLLRREGTSVLLTTHHMEEAERLCDRVAIMDRGRVLVCGTPATLKRECGVDTVVALTLADPSAVPAARLSALAHVRSVDTVEGGYRIGTTAGQTHVAQIVTAALDGTILHLSVTEPTLETVFITLTGRELRD
ncbi:ATP-binding cassette domain-containing protein [Micromonospora wenchangensis]|uniref:ABC transporter ATP-binding protein n=1 Tax=Micromonospora wenchangensis TaxID=1185415 RepID=UPI003D739E15